VANSTLPVPFISDPIEHWYVGNIEVLQEQLILLPSPLVEKSSMQISKTTCTMLERGSANNKKSSMFNSEVTL
jgi:hypothetical protein